MLNLHYAIGVLVFILGSTCGPALPQQAPTPAAPQVIVPPPSPASTVQELEQQADSLRARKAYADALDYYQAALKKEPRSAVLLNKAGMAELQLTHFDKAKKFFERAIKADRSYAEAFNNLGATNYAMRKYKPAIREFQKALKLSESASFHANLGAAYFGNKEVEKAFAEYSRAVELDPEVFERHSEAGIMAQMPSVEDRGRYSFVLARIFAKQGNIDRALLYLRRSIEDGYKNISDAYNNADFAAVRKDPRFTQLMASKPVAIPD